VARQKAGQIEAVFCQLLNLRARVPGCQDRRQFGGTGLAGISGNVCRLSAEHRTHFSWRTRRRDEVAGGTISSTCEPSRVSYSSKALAINSSLSRWASMIPLPRRKFSSMIRLTSASISCRGQLAVFLCCASCRGPRKTNSLSLPYWDHAEFFGSCPNCKSSRGP